MYAKVSQWINMSGLTARAVPAASTHRRMRDAAHPARVCCQCRSRSQTRSIARRHVCEQNLWRGDRRRRTNPS